MFGNRNRLKLQCAVCLLLALVTIAAYWQLSACDFVGFDDYVQLVDNPYLHEGITGKTIAWAFSFESATYWHPLTWLSHMLGFQIFGFKPGMQHLINLFFHIANTLLLFVVLKRMTGALWESAFVAGLFALHPLNVESVAWVTERKNVLSTFFWMLTMLAYVRYTARPGFLRYLAVFAALALGLMAKPMLVTIPFVLLLLDYWPLERFRLSRHAGNVSPETGTFDNSDNQSWPGSRLVLEKIPLLVLSAVSISLSALSVQNLDTTILTGSVPMKLKIANVPVSYVIYIKKMLWPSGLAVLYPYPETVPLWQAVGAGLLLAGVTILVLRKIKLKPYLSVGWLWFIGTLVPVIGLVQVGLWPAMADRFAYVPVIGLFILIAWGISDILSKQRYRRIMLGILTAGILSALMICTWLQSAYWKSSLDLFERAVQVTANNWLAHNNLGTAKFNKGQIDEAIGHYKTALSIKPDYITPHYNLGNLFLNQGKIKQAAFHLEEALKIKPEHAYAHYSYGNLLVKQGRLEEAASHFLEAIKRDPEYAEAYNQIGVIRGWQKNYKGARMFLLKAIQIKPDYFMARKNLEDLSRFSQKEHQGEK
ncbi:MAG: tetratricopeptide repeat protein [Desulfobacterales bacterium]|uniref:Tetratricopeptide repeat protein n=1 Tax=Candidatus Desulfatibia vada TaxID=2841696 RepID=A0A8J6NUB2_9BACT|nr:tetratricopeptide repeat protein [Candidatus Desulfatibia vada]